jgi:hypothetical protein
MMKNISATLTLYLITSMFYVYANDRSESDEFTYPVVNGLSIVEFTLVSSQRISRFDYKYIYKVILLNNTNPLLRVSGHVTSTNSNVQIEHTTIDFGDMRVGDTSQSTIIVEHNRRLRFSENDLAWLFTGADGTDVAPYPVSGGRDTIEGIDSNSDGIRDDLEHAIARAFPVADMERRAATAAVSVLQEQILSEGLADLDDLIDRSLNAARCIRFIGGEELYNRYLEVIALGLDTQHRYQGWASFQTRASGSTWLLPAELSSDMCAAGVL